MGGMVLPLITYTEAGAVGVVVGRELQEVCAPSRGSTVEMQHHRSVRALGSCWTEEDTIRTQAQSRWDIPFHKPQVSVLRCKA